jgi:uncharacterized protein (TIGR00255 family)
MEIRSVNSRFLDLGFRLSDELRAHEPALRELVSSRVRRGKVEVRAYIDTQGNVSVRDPSARLLQRLSSLQDSVRAWLPDAAPLGVADVLRLASGESEGSQDHREALLALARQTLDEFMHSREREGAKLAAMLGGHVAQLRLLADRAKPLVPQLVAQQRQRFLERWTEALGLAGLGGAAPGAAEGANDRALQEATAFAIRIDVAEELIRLAAHLDELDRLLAKPRGELGKRLDFVIQELHREANTLGSKSAVLEMTQISVDMKVLIEQMREQVQNIE